MNRTTYQSLVKTAVLLACLAAATLLLFSLPSTAVAIDCSASPSFTAATSAELSDAITCINSAGAGTYSITLLNDITITTSTPPITNSAATSITIDGDIAHQYAVGAQVDARPFNIASGVTVTMQNLTVRDGHQTAVLSYGAGIYNDGNLTLDNTRVIDNYNQNASGGGIYNGPGATLTIQNGSVISTNSASFYHPGGGIYSDGGIVTIRDSSVEDNSAGSGAGLYATTAYVLITGSTFSGNFAYADNAYGGAIMHREGGLTVINSTISDNGARSHSGGIAAGGAIYAVLDGTQMDTVLINTTVNGNNVDGAPGVTAFGGGIVQKGGALTLRNTIVANSFTVSASGGDCVTLLAPSVSGHHNLIEDPAAACGLTDAVNGNIIGSDPHLLPLDDYGGSTLTVALGAGSPAVNAGDNALALDESSSPLATDQRGAGFPRFVDTTVDIGAYEATACPTFPISVAGAAALNLAIDCYNALAAPGAYTIALTSDFALRHPTVAVENVIPGVDLLLDGAGFAIDGRGNQALAVNPSTTVSVQDLEIHDAAASNGGAIHNLGALDLNGVYLHLNSAHFSGGAIYNEGGLVVSDAILIGNEVRNVEGGALYNAPGAIASLSGTYLRENFAQTGGGIYNAGTLLVSGSTFHDNNGTTGGAIANLPTGSATITNSTFSGSSADNYGGAINNEGGEVTITNSTFVGSSAGSEGSAIRTIAAGQVTLNNSIITASQTSSDCYAAGGGTFNGASNLIDNFAAGDCSAISSAAVTDIDLTLADNGGPTPTHILLAGSNALDAGSNALAVDEDLNPLATDQRGPGFPRVLGGTVDVGAVEGALTCAGFPTIAEDVSELNGAIYCFNQETTSGTYVINVGRDIDLSFSTREIDNPTPEVTLEIEGRRHTVDGQGQPGIRPFHIAPDTTVTISDLTITGGRANGIYNLGNLLLEDLTVTANSGQCGGVFNESGTLAIVNSIIAGNIDDNYLAGGVSSVFGGVQIIGSTVSGNVGLIGGIGSISTRLEVTASTIAGNTGNAFGGGIFTYVSESEIANATISGNTSPGPGGGLYNAVGHAAVINSTISGNSAAGGGGILTEPFFSPGYAAALTDLAARSSRNALTAPAADGEVTLVNTIITGSTGGDCLLNGGSINGANNLVDEFATGGCSGVSSAAVTNFDPNLQLNGGGTLTHFILPGSNAIDAGDDALCADYPIFGLDQRGVPRPQGAVCDIGAVENTAQAALSGVVALQGRGTPGSPGTVTIGDLTWTMPRTSVPFDAITGAFSFDSVPVASGGTDYDVTAVHDLYLVNRRAPAAVPPAANLDIGTTTLKGGDANYDALINILDLACMGAAYNTPGGTCGGQGGTDINNDGITNILDLAIAGGNYNLTAPQPWLPVP